MEKKEIIVGIIALIVIVSVIWWLFSMPNVIEEEHTGTVTDKWSYESHGYDIFVLEINEGFTMKIDHKTWNQTEIGDAITFTISEVEN